MSSENISLTSAAGVLGHWLRKSIAALLLTFCVLTAPFAQAQDLLISIANPPAGVTFTSPGDTQFFQNAGVLTGSNTPISLRATLLTITPNSQFSVFTSGDDPVVRADTGPSQAVIRWEVFNRNTGAPINGNPRFLISDIDGSNGNPVESVSAQCAGLTSFTTNGVFLAGCNANNNGACDTNIRVTEINGTILAEGTQNQSGGQPQAFMQYNWTNVSSWVVTYIVTRRGRWFVHDADGDTPFDASATLIDLVDLATIKTLTSPPAAPGGNVVFEVELSNAGPAPATGANITDVLPAGLSLVSAIPSSGNVNVNGQQIDWNGVAIPVGGVETLTITATVNANVAPGTSLSNVTNTAQADQSKCSSRDSLTSTFVVDEPPEPILSVVKSIDPSTSLSGLGDAVIYRYVVSNDGNVQIDNVAPVDIGPTFNGVAATNALSAFAPTSATLAPGQSQTFSATYQLSATDIHNMAGSANPLTAIDNSATATGVPVDGILAAVTPSLAETGFQPDASLTVTKSVSNATSFSAANDTITYQYVVVNNGDITVENAAPTDVGPTFNGVAGTNALSSFSPTAANIPPNGASQTFTATYVLSQVDVDNMAAGVDPLVAIDNTTSATGDPIGNTVLPPVPSSTVETGFAPAPQMTVAKSVSTATAFSAAGDTITYQYVVSNTGNVTVNSAVPTDAGPTFDGSPATNSLSPFSPASASIAPNSSQTFTATYLIDQVDVDNMAAAANQNTAIDNTASATGTPVGGILPAVPPSDAETGFAVQAGLALTKTAGAPSTNLGSNPSATDAGDTIVYSYAVSNAGDLTIGAISINDVGPTFNGAAASGVLGAIACAQASLAPGQSTTCTATYTLTQGDVNNASIGGTGAVENTATAAGEDPAGGNVVSPPSTANQTIAIDSSIELDKRSSAPTTGLGADSSIVDPGDTVDYEVEVTNSGNTTLSNVLISDSLVTLNCPATTTLVNPFVNNGTGSLAVGDSITCTATYTLSQTDLNNGGVQNTASVAAQDPTGNNVNDSDLVNTGFTQKASVGLVKNATALPAIPADGDPITYTFELSNTGNVSLTAPQVSDPICETPPGPLTLANGFDSGDNGNGILDTGETWVFECEYTIDAQDILDGEVSNTATGSGTPPANSGLTPPTSTASNLVDAQQNAAISLDKTASLPTTANGTIATATDANGANPDTVSYTFVVENTGNVALTNVTVTDTVITGGVNCPSGAALLAPGAQIICTASYDLQLSDVDGGQVDNTATATGTPPVVNGGVGPQLTPPQGQSSATVSILPAPALEVAKSVTAIPNPLVDGGTITYSYTVTNTGNVTINGAVPIDGGPTFNGVPGTNSLGAFGPVSANLAPDASQVFNASYTLSQADIDGSAVAADPLTAIDNTATATGTPVAGNLPAVPPSTVETGVAIASSVELVKTSVAPAAPIAGQDITYTFVLSNTGDTSLSNPSITDAQCVAPVSPLNAGSGFVSGDGGTLGVLDVNESWTFSCAYTLQQSDIDAGTVQNTATGSGNDPAGSPVTDVSDSNNPADTGGGGDDPTNTPLTQTPSWSLAKSTNSMPSMVGDTLIYNFVLTNTGNVSISGVGLTDSKCAANPSLISGDLDNNNLLAPSEVWNYSCTSIPVTQAEIDAGQVDNQATATGTPPNGILPPADSLLVETPIVQNPQLSLVKSAGTPTTGLGANAAATDAGDTIAYSFLLKNDGNVTLDNLVVTDTGPTFNGSAGTGTMGPIVCPVSVLAPTQSTTCSATYTLSQTDVDSGITGGVDAVENTANAAADDPNDVSTPSGGSLATTTITANSSVDVQKSAAAPTVANGADATLVDSGDTITFTIVASNDGNATLSNVVVTDSLATVSCAPTTSNGQAFAGGILQVGDSISCTATYTVDQNDLNAGQVVNTAAVDAQDPAGNPVNGVAQATSGFTQKTSIVLGKSASVPANNPAALNEVITYSFTLENTGNVSLTDAEVDDPNCQAPVGPLTRSNGYLAGDSNNDQVLDSDETWTFSCTYTVDQDDLNAGGVSNTAVATANPPAGSGLTPPSSTAGSLAELQQQTGISLDKVAGMPTTAAGNLNAVTDEGDAITYTFTIENTGNVTLDSIVISDPLIENAPNNGTIVCTSTLLNAGETTSCTATYTLTLDDVNSGMVSNTATATGNPPASTPPAPPPTGTSSAMVVIPSSPELSITKSASTIPLSVVAGDLITYTFLISNDGNVSIDNVEPMDTGPVFNGVVGTNSLSVFTPTTPSTTSPITLDPGQSQTFTATYEFSQQDLDNMAAATDPANAINNSATADGEPPAGVLPPVPPADVQTGIAPSPSIELIKTSTPPAVFSEGEEITYTFTLLNNGNVTISGAVVNDAQCQTPISPLSFTNGYVGDDGNADALLDVDETWTLNCTYALTQADIDAGTVQNTAQAEGQDPGGNLVRDNSDSGNGGDDTGADNDPTNTPLTRTPAWTVIKSTTSLPTQAGDTLVYQFVVDNTGNVSISNAVVSDAKCAAAPLLINGDINNNAILEPSEIFTYECTSIAVTQTEVDAGTVDNDVVISGTPPTGTNLPNEIDDEQTPVVPAGELSVVKSAAAPTTGLGALTAATDAGDQIIFTFAVSNDGNVTIDNLIINDQGISFDGTAGDNSIGAISCAATTLTPGQTTSCTGVYTLTQDDIDRAIAGGANSVSNSATVSGDDPSNTGVTSPPNTATTTINSMPEIEVVKALDTGISPNPSTAAGDASITDIGDTISYTLTVSNTGNAELTSVNVVDSIAVVSCPAVSIGANPFSNPGGTLAVGDSVVCTAVYTLDQADLNAGTIQNVADVSAVDAAGTGVTDDDVLDTTLTRKASLILGKTGVQNFAGPIPVPGDTVDYTFTLENTGNVSLTATEVDDPVCDAPAGPLTRTNGYVSGDTNNDSIFDADETWIFSCQVTLENADIDDGGVQNTAIATGTPPVGSGLTPPMSTAGTQTVLDQESGISLDKVAGSPTTNAGNSMAFTDVGDTVTYTFNLQNTGNVTLTRVAVTDDLITDAPNNGSINCVFPVTNGTLLANETATCTGIYTLDQTDIDTGEVANSASVTGNPPATVPAAPPPEAVSSALVPIAPQPNMSIAKSAVLPDPFEAGETIVYTFVVTNTGNVTIDDVLPVDSGPSFNGVAGESTLGAFTPTTPSTILPIQLAPTDAQTFTADYVLTQGDIDNMSAALDQTMAIDNSATATGTPVNGNLPAVPPSVVMEGVPGLPVLTLVKTSTPPVLVAAGALVTYNFSLTNDGNVTVSNPIVSDALCQQPIGPLSFTNGFTGGDTGITPLSLDVDETWTFSCQYAITQTDIDAGTVQNTATASGQDPGGRDVSDVSDDDPLTGVDDNPTDTPLIRNPAFAVAKSTNSVPRLPGDTLLYEFRLTNTGNVSINTIGITDLLCDGGPTLDNSTDAGADLILTPAGLNGSPAPEQWLFTCTSFPIDQGDIDAGVVDNDVTVTGVTVGGNPPNAVDAITTPVDVNPQLNLVKEAGSTTLNSDGTFDQEFNFALLNSGNITLNNVSFSDDIPAQFGVCFDSVVSVGTVALQDIAPANDSITPTSGAAPVIATTPTLAVGDSIAVSSYIVRFDPNVAGCTFPNPATNTATAAGTPANGGPAISDVSDSGNDPSAGNPNDGGVPTRFTPPAYDPALGSSKAAGTPILNVDGTFDVEYTVLIENTGNVDLDQLSLVDDLVTQMGSAFTASPASNPSSGVLVAPAVSSVTDSAPANLALPNVNVAWDGTGASDMFDGVSGLLGVGDRIQVTFTVRLDPFAIGAPALLQNSTESSGDDPSGTPTSDVSDSGDDPTVNPGGPGSPTTVTPPLFAAGIEIIKNGSFNSDGTISYEFQVTNTGEVELTDVTVTDPLLSSVVYSAVDDADNDGDIDLLSPMGSAVVTATYTLSESDLNAGQVENSATASGNDPGGAPVTDVSDSGNPSDETGGDDDPTVTPFAAPSIGVAKDVVAGSPIDLGNGSYQMTYQFVVSNTGPFDLSNVQLVDDLQAMINNPNPNNATLSNAVVSSPNSTLTANPAYDGLNVTDLLSGNDTLLVGASGLLQLTFRFTPDVYFGPFLNQAEVSAQGPGGFELTDLSEDGNTVNSDTDSVTPFSIATPSTPINLGWFRSSGNRGQVVFEWATEVEVSNVGFYLSVKDEQGFWHRINSEMIPAQGDSTDAQAYAFIGYGVVGETFMLTDVSVTGKQVDHGPFTLGEEFGVRSSRRATNWEAIRAESERKQQQRQEERRKEMRQRLKQLEPQTQIEHRPSLWQRFAGVLLSVLVAPANAAELASFSVQEPGLYKVSHSQLMSQGIDLRGIGINRISIEESNAPWPVRIQQAQFGTFDENSWIMFPARGLDTLYSGTNKYTLVLDEEPPLTIQFDDTPMPEGTVIAYSYLAEQTYAPQNKYTHISPSTRDAWYADSLRAITAPAQKQVSLLINDYAPALNTAFNIGGLARMPAPRPRLEVNLWGSSDLPGNGVENPDHHVLIELNSAQVADVTFDGVREFPVEQVVTNLAYGNNTVKVSLPKDTGYQFDLVNLDRITLRYPRLFNAINNGSELVFESPWNFFRVGNLASNEATVVRVDRDRQSYIMTQRGEGNCNSGCVYFSGSDTDQTSSYFVATNEQLRTPQIELLPNANNILAGTAPYLLIAHPDFINANLQSYANELSQQYGGVDIVSVEDIYAQYSGHVVDAEAIREYIREAYDQRATRHVALVGGDMYDYRDNLKSGAQSFIPSLYVQIATNVNAVPSDASYADIDDDLIPDITITRLPVRSTAELSAMLAKRQTYLSRSYVDTAVMASDDSDASGYSFSDDANGLTAAYLSAWNVDNVDLETTNVSTGKQNLLASLNQGSSLTAYFGHSSTDRWSISGLFTSQDVAALDANRPSVITQWGCWNTFYVSPTQDSLAQRLLTDGEGGAVTLMGATSFTKADAEQRMAALLFERLSQGIPIGEAVLSAKQALAAQTPYQLDVLLGWAVLGPDDFTVTSGE